MLKVGEVVKIGEKEYKVTDYGDKLPCQDCDLKDCSHNEGYDGLKARMFALSCVDLIPLNTCFKEVVNPDNVESSPQVDGKC